MRTVEIGEIDLHSRRYRKWLWNCDVNFLKHIATPQPSLDEPDFVFCGVASVFPFTAKLGCFL
jgi:hypothetical protein